MIKITFVLSLLMLFSFQAVATMLITPEQLTKRIKAIGAKAVIAELEKNDESQWEYILKKISEGENSWLTIATLLAPGSDAATSEILTVAVANALPHNPLGTLSILNDDVLPLSTKNVCSLPFYNISKLNYNAYIVDSIQRLYKVANSKDCIDTMVNTIGKSNGFVEDN